MTDIPFIMLDDKNSDVPLYRQIYEAMRRAILNGEFESGKRLPATRLLATQLGVSRTTVINAYEQLFAEGYLEGKTGAGTFVAACLPEDFLQTPRVERRENKAEILSRKLNFSDFGKNISKESLEILHSHQPSSYVPFRHGQPAIDKFPFDVWTKIANKCYYSPRREMFGYGEPAGFRPLREAVAAHLKSARGVNCTPEQVIITNGAQQAFDLIGRIFLEPKTEVWIENPCHQGARTSFQSFGAKLTPVAVDKDGFDLAAALKQSKNARLVYVTPSHQFPLGLTMSLPRRLSLIEWARANDSWIVEDDYDSEYRYAGRPLASLQGLDRNGRVIYIGTFSKTIFPALRLGCLVVPPDLIEIFTAVRALGGAHSPLVDQAILAEFIAEGHFARHVRRMRTLYQERQQVLVEESKRQMAGLLEVSAADAGMHVIGWLPENISDKRVAEKAALAGLSVAPVSGYNFHPPTRNGLMLGYTAFTEKQIKEGVRKLARILREIV